jgi:hypothetical protein
MTLPFQGQAPPAPWSSASYTKNLTPSARYHGGPHLAVEFHRIADRRGHNKARVAIARRLLTLAYYGLRDGEIRCLTQEAA